MKFSFVLSLLVPLAFAGCASANDAAQGEGETEPSSSSQDELKSAVSCHENAVTGYRSGSPYAMTVITVGTKATAKPTAHAFLRLQTAADKAGVTLSISSGFRTMAEQEHFWSCYQTGSCNGGNLAARPGYSNHQNGHALDLATNNWSWVVNNAGRFGFERTVAGETWHYEFSGSDPGGPCSGTTASAPPAETQPAASGGCWSPTLGKTAEVGACVQSASNDVTYQCHDGLWYRGVSGGKGPYGACTSQN